MAADPRFGREALQLHYFFAAERFPDGGSPLLRVLWETCAQAGMDDFPGGGDPALPSSSLAPGLGYLSFGRRRDATRMRQAVLYRLNDVIGLTVMLAAEEGFGRTPARSAQVLHGLERTWDTACRRAAGVVGHRGDDDPSALGTVRAYRSLVRPGTATLPADLPVVGEALRRELAPSARLSRPVEPGDGLALWEIRRPARGVPAGRSLLLTAPADDHHEGLLDDWSWTAAQDGLVPLTRYLIHAAVLRDQYRIRLESSEQLDRRLQDLRRQGDELTRSWQELLTDSLERPRTGRRDLVRWESLAVRAQRVLAEERLAGSTSGALQVMARTVDVAGTGMRVLGTGADGQPRTLDSDEECRARLTAALDDDLAYLSVAREQVAEAARVAAESAAQRLQSHQQHLTLIQTTVIGALLMTLTAVQALEYRLPLPGRLHAPLITTLGSLGLGLPLLVLRRWRAGAGGRLSSFLELFSMIAMGAAVGWLVGSAVGHTAPAVVAGAVLSGAAGWWMTRRPDRPAPA